MKKFFSIFFFSMLLPFLIKAQIGNYVSNGSFESLNTNSLSSYYNVINYWQPIDTNKFADFLATSLSPIQNIPHAGTTFQYPKTGDNYIISTLFCPLCTANMRGYPRNRLKKNLGPNKIYCVKYYVSIANRARYGIDAIGVYFGSSTIDTIKYCNIPLVYLAPQVANPSGNIITDTLNWIAMTGTYTASGNEKYLILGNFKSNSGTNTVTINTSTNAGGTDVCIDDVSVIEVDLPAYAGPDHSIAPGDSVYLGRELDFAIDSGCTWYQLPNTNTVIRKASGLWVKPVTTTTYVVRQILECSPEKWDTVVVYMNLVGIERIQAMQQGVKLVPQPASNDIELIFEDKLLAENIKSIEIYNSAGELIREEEVNFENSKKLDLKNLGSGVYTLRLSHKDGFKISKKLLISR